ncbi:hypothetical protein [Psychromonas sp. SP041]|uniref:hypothetical protein n=1 Tax=Psychromonas sp. SP041 TaxID=1365007 RepID=UPI00040B41D0|nr:hypothetical protein [Psychromonas sp. SP041]
MIKSLFLLLIPFIPQSLFAEESNLSESTQIIFPAFEGEIPNESKYVKDVLRLAASKSGVEQLPKPSSKRFNNDLSASLSLIEGDDITIMWSGSNRDMESSARAIYFPIYRGLLGYRAVLTSKHLSKYICNSRELRDLTEFTFGVGYGWTETQVYADHGFSTVRLNENPLFELTSLGKIDILTRSIFESKVLEKQRITQNEELVECNNLNIFYPHYLYFYVNKSNEKLYQTIKKGLEISMSDGSFQKLFSSTIKNSGIEESIKNRSNNLIRIRNKFLSSESKKIKRNLLFRLGK